MATKKDIRCPYRKEVLARIFFMTKYNWPKIDMARAYFMFWCDKCGMIHKVDFKN